MKHPQSKHIYKTIESHPQSKYYPNQYYCTSELEILHMLSYQSLWTSWGIGQES